MAKDPTDKASAAPVKLTPAAPAAPVKPTPAVSKPTTLEEYEAYYEANIKRIQEQDERIARLEARLSNQSSNTGGEQPSVGASMAKGAGMFAGAWVFVGLMSLIPPWPIGFLVGVAAVALYLAAPKIIENIKNLWNSAFAPALEATNPAPALALNTPNPALKAPEAQNDQLADTARVVNSADKTSKDPSKSDAVEEQWTEMTDMKHNKPDANPASNVHTVKQDQLEDSSICTVANIATSAVANERDENAESVTAKPLMLTALVEQKDLSSSVHGTTENTSGETELIDTPLGLCNKKNIS